MRASRSIRECRSERSASTRNAPSATSVSTRNTAYATVSLTRIGSLIPAPSRDRFSFRLHHVTDAADRTDQAGRLELAPQVPQIDVDHVRRAGIVLAPDL